MILKIPTLYHLVHLLITKTKQNITDIVKNMITKDARCIGLSKRQLFGLKKTIKKLIEAK
ncbi:hypothetical protein Mia14_1008 [Candidatus Mancarchaeum acidiphilum]|uniref:Uncharacterized protein n=1 Tax=Candidatus Mancarchaeum acidiphilum TaxID=1920749 RepID=A0A218NPC4_9ARCH|nr:hypothetical protein Mia14_1008 [Candidatus Mancarchaeum acidiphilum]